MMIDGRMPNLDGPAAMAEIRAGEAPAGRTPIVAVIAGDADEAADCLSAGADVVLRKPVAVAAVARAVADARAPQTGLTSRHVA
jgi:CheY-like chemotaxis protein